MIAVTLLSGLPATVYQWADGRELQNPVELSDGWDVRFAPDGHALALSRSNPPRVEIWDTATWKRRAEISPCWITESTFAINSVLPVCAAVIDGALTLYSLETGSVIRTLDFELGRRALCVCFSPDGLTCAAGGSNKRFVVFDVDL
jgi:WD40 repeat protein